jgi:hypothetical protein
VSDLVWEHWTKIESYVGSSWQPDVCVKYLEPSCCRLVARMSGVTDGLAFSAFQSTGAKREALAGRCAHRAAKDNVAKPMSTPGALAPDTLERDHCATVEPLQCRIGPS